MILYYRRLEGHPVESSMGRWSGADRVGRSGGQLDLMILFVNSIKEKKEACK